MAMEFTVYSLNGLLLRCLRSKYEPEIFYDKKVTFKDPCTKTAVYGQIYQFSNMALRQAK